MTTNEIIENEKIFMNPLLKNLNLAGINNMNLNQLE